MWRNHKKTLYKLYKYWENYKATLLASKSRSLHMSHVANLLHVQTIHLCHHSILADARAYIQKLPKAILAQFWKQSDQYIKNIQTWSKYDESMMNMWSKGAMCYITLHISSDCRVMLHHVASCCTMLAWHDPSSVLFGHVPGPGPMSPDHKRGRPRSGAQ